jgi:hypothetical protein
MKLVKITDRAAAARPRPIEPAYAGETRRQSPERPPVFSSS